MRRFARTTVLASTAAVAAAIGAVALAPIVSADEPAAPVGPLGSAVADAPDLVVEFRAVCDLRDEDLPEGSDAALEITLKNVGKGAASNVTTNYAVLPDVNGVFTEEKVAPGEEIVYTVPSAVTEWVSRPAGVAVFSPQIDANYPNNVAFGLLSIDCAPEVVAPAE